MARFTSKGLIDTTFGNHGVASLGTNNYGHALLLSGDGNLYVGASHPYLASDPTDSSVHVYKFTADGAVDDTFGSDGVASYGDTQNQFVAETLDMDGLGRLILGFSRYLRNEVTDGYQSFQLARFTTTGDLDSSFNSSGQQAGIPGVALTDTLPISDNQVFQTHWNADGSLLMVGYRHDAGVDSQFLVRLLDDASADPAFGASATPGRIEAPVLSTHFDVTGATQESASSLLVVGINAAADPNGCGFITRVITDQTFNDSFESTDIPFACPSAP